MINLIFWTRVIYESLDFIHINSSYELEFVLVMRIRDGKSEYHPTHRPAHSNPRWRLKWPSTITRLTVTCGLMFDIWWFASIEKECGHTWHQISWNKTNSDQWEDVFLKQFCKWMQTLGKLMRNLWCNNEILFWMRILLKIACSYW